MTSTSCEDGSKSISLTNSSFLHNAKLVTFPCTLNKCVKISGIASSISCMIGLQIRSSQSGCKALTICFFNQYRLSVLTSFIDHLRDRQLVKNSWFTKLRRVLDVKLDEIINDMKGNVAINWRVVWSLIRIKELRWYDGNYCQSKMTFFLFLSPVGRENTGTAQRCSKSPYLENSQHLDRLNVVWTFYL